MRIITAFMLLALSACDNYPADPSDTLFKVQDSGQLRVGVIEFRPWSYRNNNEIAGIEVDLVSDFAEIMNLETQWEFLPEALAVERLKNHEIDLLIGGLVKSSPRSKELGFTRPYLRTGDGAEHQHVLAVSSGENRFLTTLELFLQAHDQEIRQLYQEQQAL